jgi:hypothetical protein
MAPRLYPASSSKRHSPVSCRISRRSLLRSPHWTEFLAALAEIDQDMAVNIEHEDADYSRVDGLALAAENLRAAAKAAGV